MILQIGYGLAAVVCLRKVFPAVLTWGSSGDQPDSTDLLFATFVSCLISLAWPLIVVVRVIYHFLLEPIVKEINLKNAGDE